MSQVHELAVRIVKPGRDELFAQRRGAFIKKLKSQKGVLADREFESFFALPGMDERPVFIGMTTYDALSTVNWIQMNPMVMLKFMPFFMTLSLKAYVFMEQTDGPDFDLSKLAAHPGSVVHIAVRKPNGTSQDEHLAAQKAFLDLLLARDGVGPHYEFKAVKGFDVAGATIGITEFADDEAMASAFEALSEHDAFLAYTKTFDTVASQFARTTSND